MDTDRIREFVDARNTEARLKGELEEAKEHRRGLEAEVLAEFADIGVDSINIDGAKVSISSRTYAAKRVEGMPTEEIADALIANGLVDLVKPTFNWQTLSRYVRDLIALEDPDVELDPDQVLPPELQTFLRVHEEFGLRVTKA